MKLIKNIILEVAEGKQGKQAKPDVIIIVGLYVDTCKKIRDQFGLSLSIEEGVLSRSDRNYPHIAAVAEMVKVVNNCIHHSWKDVEVFWTTPAPVDFY